MRRGLFLAVLALLSTLAAVAQQSSSYRIGAKDLLEIRVDEDQELNREERVSDGGTIVLPRIGVVDVAGKTTLEIEAEIRSRLEARFLRRATVAVRIKEFRSKPISVLGAVVNPGDLGFSGRWTLLQAITAAGGFAENHGPNVYILRRAENGLTSQLEIPVQDLIGRADPKFNIPIFVNDLIRVPPAVEATIYCLGEVARPGALTFTDKTRITFLAAIASAGGLTDRASSKIRIRRPDSDSGSSREIIVDYKAMIQGNAPDVELFEGDVIIVKESFF